MFTPDPDLYPPAKQSRIAVTWEHEYQNVPWTACWLIDEVHHGEYYNNSGAELKQKLDMFYREKNMPKESSLHYMGDGTNLPPGLERVLDHFQDKLHHVFFLKITPGHQVWLHADTYATFMKVHGISNHLENKIHRTVVMMDDWKWGQVLQAGDKIFSNWLQGDTYTWQGHLWHGACNFGYDDLVVMQITWIDPGALA